MTSIAVSPLVLAFPLAVQGLVLTADEALFHRRRGLPRWERIGHPLDTATLLACLLWARLAPWSSGAAAVYAGLAAFSCLFVTKDEAVHTRACSAAEHWLHALLFLLHPIALAAAALQWRQGYGSLLVGEIAACGGFMLYQIIYWNVLREPQDQQRVL